MTLLRRWAERVWLGIDRAVAEIEDHDALVVSTLDDVRRTVATTRARLERVTRDGIELRARLASEREAVERWRALARSEDDDERALEALRQAHRVEAGVARLQVRVEEHRRGQEHLEEYLAALRDNVAGLEQQLEQLRTRAARAESAPELEAGRGALVAALERWEATLTRARPPADPMDEEFDALRHEQEQRALRSELEALRRERKSHAGE